MSVKIKAALTVVLIGLALTGCTNRPSEQTLFSEVKSRLKPKEKQVPLDAQQMRQEIQQALSIVDGPLSLVSFEGPGTSAVIRVVETNGAYRTWGSWGISERRSLTTKNGIITATRGLGRDLLSSDIDSVLALISSRHSGVANRVQRYLDGNNEVVVIEASCTVTNAGALPGKSNVYKVTEQCVADHHRFDNQYNVSASGEILMASQWLGEYFGQSRIEKLR